jgi:hypothetical protein
MKVNVIAASGRAESIKRRIYTLGDTKTLIRIVASRFANPPAGGAINSAALPRKYCPKSGELLRRRLCALTTFACDANSRNLGGSTVVPR